MLGVLPTIAPAVASGEPQNAGWGGGTMQPVVHSHSCPLALSCPLRQPQRAARRPSPSQQPAQGRLCCRAGPQEQEEPARPSGRAGPQADSTAGQDAAAAAAPSTAAAERQNNALLAVGAVLAGVALFAATRLGSGPATLATLQRVSIPYEEALTNGKPTLLEFYADWCEICRATAPDVYQVSETGDPVPALSAASGWRMHPLAAPWLGAHARSAPVQVEQQQADKLNFVMMNVDNNAWTPEKYEYRVSGIPHFVFLDKQGQARGAAIGKLPKQVPRPPFARWPSSC